MYFSACENPGNVNMSEIMLGKDIIGKTNLLFVLQHEMAHMWWGNYVNIAWWNELINKEAFADYSAYLAYRS